MIAIKTKDDDILWFDAVLSFSEDLSRSVTAFPVQSGGSISDHVAEANKQFSLSGLFTSASFITDYDIGGGGVLFVPQLVDEVVVDYNRPSPFKKLIPEAIANLITPDNSPSVTMASEATASRAELAKDKLRAMWESKQFISILELDDSQILKRVLNNIMITSLSFPESPEDGDSVPVQLQFLQIRLVTLLKADAPVVADNKLQTQSGAGGDKGTGNVGAVKTDATNSSNKKEVQQSIIISASEAGLGLYDALTGAVGG